MSEWETGTKIDFLATHPDATGFELVLRIKRDDLGYVSGSVTTSTTTTTSGGIIQNVTYNSMILRYNENLTLGDYPGLNTTITTNGTLITNGCILRYEPGVGFAIEPKIEYDPETITVHTNVTSTSYFNTTFRHEFGHAIGFPHEHQKWNRDNYLDFINTSDANSDQYAIIPQYQTWTTSSTSEVQTSSLGCGFLWLFPCYETVTTTTQHESGSGINLINGFDYESIMIYDNRFYYDGSTEIIRRPGYISPLDKDAVNIFYP